jgi:hypothetical protein
MLAPCPLTDSNRRPLLTILEPSREARAQPGLRSQESPANGKSRTAKGGPRVDMRGRIDVRASFARDVGCVGNNSGPKAWNAALRETGLGLRAVEVFLCFFAVADVGVVSGDDDGFRTVARDRDVDGVAEVAAVAPGESA